jgi:hypothetical protein
MVLSKSGMASQAFIVQLPGRLRMGRQVKKQRRIEKNCIFHEMGLFENNAGAFNLFHGADTPDAPGHFDREQILKRRCKFANKCRYT